MQQATRTLFNRISDGGLTASYVNAAGEQLAYIDFYGDPKGVTPLMAEVSVFVPYKGFVRTYSRRLASRAQAILDRHLAKEGYEVASAEVAAGTTSPAEEARQAAHTALRSLLSSTEVAGLVAQLQAANQQLQNTDQWDTGLGHETEYALGYLRMAIEAAEGK